VLSSRSTVTVKSIIDGDTFRTTTGKKVRLLGINTPEIAHRDSPGQVMGKQATQALSRMIAHQTVELRFDKQRKDKYHRLLAHVYVQGLWVNAALVEQGWAHVYTFEPNHRGTKQLLQKERQARQAKRGIWQSKRFAVLTPKQISTANLGQFRLVCGRVSKHQSTYVWHMSQLHISIPRQQRHLFGQQPPHIGQKICVRGRLRQHRHTFFFLSIYSPFDLELTP